MLPLVIKLGGGILNEPDTAKALFEAVATGRRQVVVVHGGGVQVDQLLQRLGMTTEKQDGVRITPREQMPHVVGVLAGQVNKQLVLWAQQAGLASVGISLLDGGISQCQWLSHDLGQVGTAAPGHPRLLEQLLNGHFVPVIASIGADKGSTWLNINADDAAVAVAQTLAAELLLLSDVEGVLDHNKQRLSQLRASDIEDLIERDVIQGGMRAKVRAALAAAERMGQFVTIGSWHNATSFLAADSLDRVVDTGTQVLVSKE